LPTTQYSITIGSKSSSSSSTAAAKKKTKVAPETQKANERSSWPTTGVDWQQQTANCELQV